MRVSLELAKARAERDMTSRQLADKAGVPLEKVQELEAGNPQSVTIDDLVKLALAMDMRVDIGFGPLD